MSFTTFFMEYKTVIIFYSFVFLMILINRKKFEIQAKFIAIYKTKWGLKLMDTLGIKYRELFRLLGLIGIGAGFFGMILVFCLLIWQLYMLIVNPSPEMGVAILIPGVKIPGAPIFVPLWYGIISIFVLATVHEFSHGVLARAYDLKIKSSGIVFFGPIIGAFVEPDEKQLVKRSDVEQYSVFAAGPFSNMILGGVCLVIFLLLSSAAMNFQEPVGVSFPSYYEEGYPMELAGIEPGSLITMIDGKEILTSTDLQLQLLRTEPTTPIVIEVNGTTKAVITAHNPENNDFAFIGISKVETVYELKEGANQIGFNIVYWFKGLFEWMFKLNFAIGLINLLPMGPIDGGRMFQTAMRKMIPNKKKADKVWARVGWFCLALIIATLLLSYAINLL